MLKYLGVPKYMALNGDGVGYPLPVRLLLRPSTLAAAFTAATLSFIPANKTHNYLLPAIFGTAVCMMLLNNRDNKDYKSKIGNKVIHTQPSEEEKIASFKYVLKAEELRKDHVDLTKFIAVGCLATPIVQKLAHVPISWPVHGIICAAVAAYEVSAIYRFNKVAKGEWAIVDEPTKEKALEHLTPKKKEAPVIALPAPAAA